MRHDQVRRVQSRHEIVVREHPHLIVIVRPLSCRPELGDELAERRHPEPLEYVLGDDVRARLLLEHIAAVIVLWGDGEGCDALLVDSSNETLQREVFAGHVGQDTSRRKLLAGQVAAGELLGDEVAFALRERDRFLRDRRPGFTFDERPQTLPRLVCAHDVIARDIQRERAFRDDLAPDAELGPVELAHQHTLVEYLQRVGIGVQPDMRVVVAVRPLHAVERLRDGLPVEAHGNGHVR